jgi:hypothetical protein
VLSAGAAGRSGTFLSEPELIGAPQNPRRITVGFDVHVR